MRQDLDKVSCNLAALRQSPRSARSLDRFHGDVCTVYRRLGLLRCLRGLTYEGGTVAHAFYGSAERLRQAHRLLRVHVRLEYEISEFRKVASRVSQHRRPGGCCFCALGELNRPID